MKLIAELPNMKQKLHDRSARRKNKHTIIIKIF